MSGDAYNDGAQPDIHGAFLSTISAVAPLPAREDFHFLRLGFRLGQALVASESSWDEDPLAPLLLSLMSNAVVAAGSIRSLEIKSLVERADTQSVDIWNHRRLIADDHGSAIPYEQIGQVIRAAVSGIRGQLVDRAVPELLFHLGELLSQGTGSANREDFDAPTDWGYADPEEEGVPSKLDGLIENFGVSIEELTGIPNDLHGFLKGVPNVDRVLRQYPPQLLGLGIHRATHQRNSRGYTHAHSTHRRLRTR